MQQMPPLSVSIHDCMFAFVMYSFPFPVKIDKDSMLVIEDPDTTDIEVKTCTTAGSYCHDLYNDIITGLASRRACRAAASTPASLRCL